MKRYTLYIILVVATIGTLCVPQGICAQERETYNVQVYVTTKSADVKDLQKTPRRVFFCLSTNENKANLIRSQFLDAIKHMTTVPVNDQAWKEKETYTSIQWSKSKPNGKMTFSAVPGNFVLISSYDGTFENADSAKIDILHLESGKNNLEHEIKLATGTIDTVVVKGKYLGTRPPVPEPEDIDGVLTQPFRIHLEPGEARSDARLIIQPMVVECGLMDTIDIVDGFVFEGINYHPLQNKRMAFDYNKNDKVYPVYLENRLSSDEPFDANVSASYVKPNPLKDYKIIFHMISSDFNHIYLDSIAASGSCNSKRPFEFLEFGKNLSYMDIDEFEQRPDPNFGKPHNTNLNLIFQEGKAIPTNDSINQIRWQHMIHELKKYGTKLNQIVISATASPEGGYEKNVQLAKERRNWAEREVKKYLNNPYVEYRSPAQPARVCTWFEVADTLAKDGYIDIATQVRSSAGENGYGGDEAIRAIPEYESIIKPMLQRLRNMNVAYTYDKPRSADEAVQDYYKKKTSLFKEEGVAFDKNDDFSDSDYYNLFTAIKDSAEIDTLTTIAYKHITRQPAYELVKFYMYIANKYAMLLQKQGVANITILKPFIDESTKKLAKRETDSEEAQKNRVEILINQLVSYIFKGEDKYAEKLYNYYFVENPNNKDACLSRSKDIHNLGLIIDFKKYYKKKIKSGLNDEEQKKFNDAIEYICSCSPDNAAAFYTINKKIFDKSEEELNTLLNEMSDKNPKKWYLKALNSASNEKVKDGYGNNEIEPEYLCYLNHCFELDPKYRRLYYREGMIGEDLRKKHPYLKNNIKKYRRDFKEYTSESEEPQVYD